MSMASKTKKRRRRSLLREQRDRCLDCGCLLHEGNAEIHHIYPRSMGGSDALGNLVLLCGPCHGRRHGHRRRARSLRHQESASPPPPVP